MFLLYGSTGEIGGVVEEHARFASRVKSSRNFWLAQSKEFLENAFIQTIQFAE